MKRIISEFCRVFKNRIKLTHDPFRRHEKEIVCVAKVEHGYAIQTFGRGDSPCRGVYAYYPEKNVIQFAHKDVFVGDKILVQYYSDVVNMPTDTCETIKEVSDYVDHRETSDRCGYCGTKIIGHRTHCKSCGAPL